jgi:hydrogenase maturation protein HypF
LAACLAENQHEGPALGIVWDGTGYGLDGTIWGGELLYGDQANSERIAYLRPFPLLGGDAAVREPRRIALALLYEVEGEAAWAREELAPLRSFTSGERGVLRQMLTRGLHTLPTSSAGRLFDGVAALIGLCQRVSFEGEAAIMLEHAADPAERGAYPIDLAWPLIDWRPTVVAILADLGRGVRPDVISARFHNTMVAAMVAGARRLDPPVVALSGGCFQNRLLTVRAAAALEAAGMPVLLHRLVPPNDGGIALGQLATAAARLRT